MSHPLPIESHRKAATPVSADLLPSERVRVARFPEGEKMTVEEVAAVVGPEFEDMHENPPESVKKKRKEMEEAMGEDHVWDQGFTALLPSERHAFKAAASYLDMFFKEKRIPSKVFEVKDSQGVTHSIPNEVVIDMIKKTRGSERKSIEATLRKIDFGNGDVNHFLAHLAKGLAESYNGALRLASEQEAEKLEAEAEANEQQAQADRAKAEAAQMRQAAQASGLYGYTKGTQRDVEASVRKAQRRALSVAKTLYAKDDRSVDFLKAHAKRANSKTARLLLTAMKVIGPRVASEKVAGSKLTSDQIKEIQGETVKSGVPVRFMSGGGSLNILTGDVTRKGTNVMHQIVYWNFTKETAKKIAGWLGARASFDKSAALELPSERRAATPFHGSPKEQLEYVVDALRLAGNQGLRVQELPRKGALAAQQKGFAEAERGQLFITPKGKSVRLASGVTLPVERMAAHVEIGKADMDALHKDGKAEIGEHTVSFKEASEKVAGGLYGHPTKTARLTLIACSDLRAYIGEVAFSLHSRRTAKYDKVTGFLKAHGKTAKCAYSRMLLDCYPDAPVAKQAAWPGATISAITDGISSARAQAGIEAMSDDDDDPVETSEEPGKTASSEIDREIKEMLKQAFVPDSVDGWIEWEDGTRTAALGTGNNKERRA